MFLTSVTGNHITKNCLFISFQVEQENVKVLTVTVIKATGVSVGGYFGDCKLLFSNGRLLVAGPVG